MEAEFVNLFIDKQKNALNDLTSRNIMLETHLAFAEQKVVEMQQVKQALEEHKIVVENLTNHAHMMDVQNQQLQKDVDRLTGDVVERDKQLKDLKQDNATIAASAEQLQATIKKLKLELEVHQAKATRLKNKAKQLIEE